MTSCSVWVPCHRLLPLDLQMAARKQNIPGKKELGLAYRLAAEQKPLRVWAEILDAYRRRTRGGANASHSAEGGMPGRPRGSETDRGTGSGTLSEATFRFPPGFSDGEETERNESLPLPTPPPSGRKTATRDFEDSTRRGREGEVTFRFPPGFVEGEEAGSSAAEALSTPTPSGRKRVRRELDDGTGLGDLEAPYEGSAGDEVRAPGRRARRAKRVRQDSDSMSA